MSLRTILIVVQALGKYRLIADGFPDWADERRLVLSASKVLAHWPKKFFALLQALGERVTQGVDASVRRQFASIFRSLFKNKSIKPQSQADFLREIFIDFATNHWRHGVVDRRLLRGLSEGTSRRFMTRAAFAEYLGVQPRTAARVLIDHGIPSHRIKSDGVSRVLVDARDVSLPRSSPGAILRVREAAKQLGMSPKLLRHLKQLKVFEVRHLSPVRPGFHSLDVESFGNRLLALVPITGLAAPSIDCCVQLRTILRTPHDSLAVKTAILDAILSREVPVLGAMDRCVGGLLLDRAAWQQFAAKARSTALERSLSPCEVAPTLQCDAGAVRGLVARGILKGIETAVGLRVDEGSVERFAKEFASLSSIAKPRHTTSRTLIRECNQQGISLLFAPIRGARSPQAFIRRADISCLLSDGESTLAPRYADERTKTSVGDH